ncbi:glycosyltransferase [Chitinophaga tropicalis]|uniref:Glycosyltransferase n=1 Tax=Chitinophaga tropicalis TaxID=2683588 RepID=A0A7K1TZA4_9BACT|nr:glycosyltransferase [Chitinophaga tropicalis]MVT07447.1 glycosyltransferase [Chitinophaga tropicalis]
MRFSVLMSIYKNDNPEHLAESLNSLLEQTLLPDEIVVIFDGPVSEQLSKVVDDISLIHQGLFKIIQLEKNGGLGKALGIAMQHCTYDIVARMDADDIAKPERFRKQIEFIKANPNVDIVGSWIEEFNHSTKNVLSLRKVPETHEEIVHFAKFRSPFNHPTVLFRKKVVIEAGGYQDYGTFEDYHLWARLIGKGRKCYNIQESLLYFRMNENMIKRRGGWKKTLAEIKLQQYFLSIGFITKMQFIRNVITRGGARIVPDKLRSIVYKFLLSSKAR